MPQLDTPYTTTFRVSRVSRRWMQTGDSKSKEIAFGTTLQYGKIQDFPYLSMISSTDPMLSSKFLTTKLALRLPLYEVTIKKKQTEYIVLKAKAAFHASK